MLSGIGSNSQYRSGANVRKGRLLSCLHVDGHCIQTAKLNQEPRTSGKLLLLPLAPHARQHAPRRHGPSALRSGVFAVRVQRHSIVEGSIA